MHGDLIMEVVTDFPERLNSGTRVFIGEGYADSQVSATRHHAHGLLMRFQGVDTPEKAGMLRNQRVYVRTADRPALPAGQFYHHELLGLEVIDEHGAVLGHLNEILQTGANDVYVVTDTENGELLVACD